MTRRELGVLAASSALASAQASKRPNILLILSDDHSVPFVGCYGADFMKTPNLDRFAAEGIRFNRAFTAAPQCVPSRTAILTGRSPVAVRMGRFNSPLPPDVVTIPEVLKSNGYRTGVCGRYYHLNGVIKPGAVTQAIYDKHKLRTWDRRVDFLEVSPPLQTAVQLDQFIGQGSSDQPWFFWINYSDPHHPWEKSAGTVDPAKLKLPPFLPDLPGVREDLAAYCSEVERADSTFGEALAVLKKRNLEDNTLVVFMGDNGMAFPHGKGSLYDPGLNVPLLVRWPGIARPSVSETLISGEDIAPTMIEAAGGKPPAQMSGRSFLGALNGSSYEPRTHVFAARLHHGNSAFTPGAKASLFDLSRCARNDRWKLIYNCTPHMEYQPVDSAKDPGWTQMIAAHKSGKLQPEFDRVYFPAQRPVLELYDLTKDPGELTNLAGTPGTEKVQRELMIALQEKMILDYDFLPPPMNE